MISFTYAQFIAAMAVLLAVCLGIFLYAFINKRTDVAANNFEVFRRSLGATPGMTIVDDAHRKGGVYYMKLRSGTFSGELEFKPWTTQVVIYNKADNLKITKTFTDLTNVDVIGEFFASIHYHNTPPLPPAKVDKPPRKESKPKAETIDVTLSEVLDSSGSGRTV